MKKEIKELKEQIEMETKKIWAEEPDELKKLRMGYIENEAGSYGQYFTTWDFANGMIRDYSMYTLYPILKLAKLSQFELEQCKKMFEVFDPHYSEYLGYSGYRTLEKLCKRFKDLLDFMETKDEFIELFVSLLRYANKVSAWSYHYFPWEIGVLYPQKTKEEIAEMARLAKI
jgi:hypothetical protein